MDSNPNPRFISTDDHNPISDQDSITDYSNPNWPSKKDLHWISSDSMINLFCQNLKCNTTASSFLKKLIQETYMGQIQDFVDHSVQCFKSIQDVGYYFGESPKLSMEVNPNIMVRLHADNNKICLQTQVGGEVQQWMLNPEQLENVNSHPIVHAVCNALQQKKAPHTTGMRDKLIQNIMYTLNARINNLEQITF